MSKTLNKLPSAMAVQRGLNISDATFYNVMEDGSLTPVLVVEHGLRGTQNVNTEKGAEHVANPQRTESAKTDPSARKLLVRFDLRAASLGDALTMCSESGAGKAGRELGKSMRAAIEGFLSRAATEGATLTLGQRYARNLLNGRWLWRNRSYAQSVEIVVLEMNGKIRTSWKELAKVEALKVSMSHFNNPTPEEQAIAAVLARGWAGEDFAPALRIEATIDFGVQGAVEVYPSQNYVERVRGFARSLYKLPLRGLIPVLGSGFEARGHAALRDQKIGNALRTVDTWYADFQQQQIVTPVEPMGANLDVGDFLRDRKESAFELLKDVDNTQTTSDAGLYLLAILVRGGVFGEKADKKRDDVDGEEDGQGS